MQSQANVLVVDDDLNFRTTLAEILGKKGYDILIAGNGQIAIDIVREKTVEVILMDVKMPVMSGVQAYKIIKRIQPSAIVIFMTAFSVEDLVKDAIRDGAYAVIKKPLDIDTVINMIGKSHSGTLLAVVDDDPEIGKAMKEVLEKKGYSITVCLTGEEAIALAKDRPRDIFFIDMKLPLLSGLETYLEIKKANPAAVVVMMTAYRQEMDELVKQAIERGAYSCLYKPFDMDDVLKIIEEIFKKKQI